LVVGTAISGKKETENEELTGDWGQIKEKKGAVVFPPGEERL